MEDISPVANGDWNGARVLVLSPTPTHPQDYGNRRRIYAVCANLKQRGARVVFLHYPAEIEWRSHIPANADNDMMRAWDRCYTIPVTRGLHSDPAGSHHTIDEWWDDAIGDFLKWLFSVQTFDVFIVNYTWLSKAFEFAPEAVAKILDTHDRFTGRKELFERNGLRPEFFYTTKDEEAKAFVRADLIWAIKDPEREEFERITNVPVLTLLHLDRPRRLPRPQPDADGYLRVGIIGARNSINVTNLRTFLAEAIPVFERFFAPIKLVIAGTICDALGTQDPRFVRMIGGTADIDAFYGVIDVACIPTAFSTGLKIKAAEAIAFGCPLLSLAHAFEGFPPQHPFHTIADFREMAERLVELSFEPGLLPDLAEASARAQAVIRRSIDDCLERSWQAIQAKRRIILYCVDAQALSATGCLRAVLESVNEYLRQLGPLAIVVVRGNIEHLPKVPPLLQGGPRMAVSREIITNGESCDALRAHGYEIAPFAGLVARFQPDVVVFDATSSCTSSADLTGATVVYRAAMIAHSQTGDFLHSGLTAKQLVVTAVSRSQDIERLGRLCRVAVITAPCLWRPKPLENHLREPRAHAPRLIAVLDAGRLWGGAVVLDLLTDLGCEVVHVVRREADVDPAGTRQAVSATQFADELFDRFRPLPDFAVDITFGAVGLQLVRELLDRFQVPTITAECQIVQPSLTGPAVMNRPTTAHELFDAVTFMLLRDRHSAPVRAAGGELDGDAGWAWIRRQVKSGRGEEMRAS